MCQNVGSQFQDNEQCQNILNALISGVTDRLINSDYLSQRNYNRGNLGVSLVGGP